MSHCKNNSHIQVVVTNFFSNSTHKTETGTASWWETTTNSNPLGPIKLSSQSETGSNQYIRFDYVYQTALGFVLGSENYACFQGPSCLQVDSLDLDHGPH